MELQVSNVQKDVLYNMYRTGVLSQEDYETYKAYDIKQDFLPAESVDVTSRGFPYFYIVKQLSRMLPRYKKTTSLPKNSKTSLSKNPIVNG